MSVYISSLCLLLIGFAAACDVSSGDDGCWEDAAANFVQMKAHTNTAVNAGNHKKPEPHEYDKELTSAAAEDGAEALAEGIDMEGTVDDEADPTTAEADMSMANAAEDEDTGLEEWSEELEADYQDEEAQPVDETGDAVNADEAAKDDENAMNFKEVTEANPNRMLKPLMKPASDKAVWDQFKGMLNKIKEKGVSLDGKCPDLSGVYFDIKKKAYTLSGQKDCEGIVSVKGMKQMDYIAMGKNAIVLSDGTPGTASGEPGSYVIGFRNRQQWSQANEGEGLGEEGPPRLSPRLSPLPSGPPQPSGPPVAIAATAPLAVYEWFKADCSGNGIKKVDGDEEAAQKECNARAACVGWAANYGTNVRRLRAKDCKKAASGKWIFYRKRISGSPVLAK